MRQSFKDSATEQLDEHRAKLAEQECMIDTLNQGDTSMVQQVTIGSTSLILSVVGVENFQALRRELAALDVKQERSVGMPSGARQVYYNLRAHVGISPDLVVIIKPDLNVCTLVQVGVNEEPVYELRCN